MVSERDVAVAGARPGASTIARAARSSACDGWESSASRPSSSGIGCRGRGGVADGVAHRAAPALAFDVRGDRRRPGAEPVQRLPHRDPRERLARRTRAEVRRERVRELEHDRRGSEGLATLRLDRDVRQVQRLASAEQHLEEGGAVAVAGDTSPAARCASDRAGSVDRPRGTRPRRAPRRRRSGPAPRASPRSGRSSRRPRAARRDSPARSRAGAPRARALRGTRWHAHRDRGARARRASRARARDLASSRCRAARGRHRRARRAPRPTARAAPRAARAMRRLAQRADEQGVGRGARLLIGPDLLGRDLEVRDPRGPTLPSVADHERADGEPAYSLIPVEVAGVILEVRVLVRLAVGAVRDPEPLGPPHPVRRVDVGVRASTAGCVITRNRSWRDIAEVGSSSSASTASAIRPRSSIGASIR